MTELNILRKELRQAADPVRATLVARYFKTGKGQYGEGDRFIGLTVPQVRSLAKKHQHLPVADILKLLHSKIHEERFLSLTILTHQFEKGDNKAQDKIYKVYLKNTKYINNWDLVDTSAPYIVGPYLLNRSKSILYKLVKSKNLWERRIAIITTLYFIKCNQFNDTLKLAELLLSDKHDLIHKATGWALRELGKKSLNEELAFLDKHFAYMPRTMLRYAIERLPEKQRLHYLKKQ